MHSLLQLTAGDIAQATTLIAAAIIASILMLQKVLKGFKDTATESNIITLMHSELQRMSTQNTLLATELNKLQLEIITLNKELGNLSAENQRLHKEVSQLAAEVVRLQKVLTQNNIQINDEV